MDAIAYRVGYTVTALPGVGISLGFGTGALAYARMTPDQRADLPGTIQEWVEDNPEAVRQIFNSSGGSVDGLKASSTMLLGPAGSRALWASLGFSPFTPTTSTAAKDVAALYRDGEPALGDFTTDQTDLTDSPPRGVEDLMVRLNEVNEAPEGTVRVETVHTPDGPRYIAYLPGTNDMGTLPGQSDDTIRDMGANLRLMGGDQTAYGRGVVEAINTATAGDPDPHVMLVGHSQGGMTAAEIASHNGTDPGQEFTVDEVVTAGSPTSQVEHIPDHVNMLSLENHGDIIPLTSGEANPDATNRTTVRFDASTGNTAENHGIARYQRGGFAVDQAVSADQSGSLAHAVQSSGGYLAGGETHSQSVVITRK